jgi:hypothetical protein
MRNAVNYMVFVFEWLQGSRIRTETKNARSIREEERRDLGVDW